MDKNIKGYSKISYNFKEIELFAILKPKVRFYLLYQCPNFENNLFILDRNM